MTRTKPAPAREVRCAIYTRKSSEEGLDQAFNSLHAQREAAEAFIASQRHEGWVCLPDHYDDGGYSGGNTERPALRRLMADIEAGRVDAVVVYKVDRLSRSLLDFAKLMGTFEQQKISFVSVTQQFNTAHSMGRLTLNILLSFAQFERELVSERTRDKIAATRRKGKWSGGRPILGYDVDREKMRLVVNAPEAERVRDIVALYLQTQSLVATARELNRRGWTTKRWSTRSGQAMGGHAWEKTNLWAHLTNPLYAGKVRYKDELHDGEHEAILDPELFERVGRTLSANGRDGGMRVRNKYGALLKGILRCTACDVAMTHTCTTRGSRVYRYYTCTNAQKNGWDACPCPSVPAGQLERLVLEQIRCVGADPGLVSESVHAARAQEEAAIASLERERTVVERDLRRVASDLAEVAKTAAGSPVAAGRLADLHERAAAGQRRLAEIDAALDRSQGRLLDEEAVRDGLPLELEELEGLDFDLSLLGFDDEELKEWMAPPGTEGHAPADEVPDPPPVATSRRGDIWLLGEHRLLCGDSTNSADVDRLMDGSKAALCATDPPYLVDYTGERPDDSGKDWSATYKEVEITDAESFFTGVFTNVLRVIAPRAAIYTWHAHKRQRLIADVWERLGILDHQQIVWVKPTPVFGRVFWHFRHEPCMLGWKQGSMPEHDSDHEFNSVWEIDWEGKSRIVGNEHPTQKPVEIFARPMRKHTRPGDICFEPFSGSGSQLIAAESLGRRCYAMELEPVFVDVAVRRWERWTQKKARRYGPDGAEMPGLPDENTPEEPGVEGA